MSLTNDLLKNLERKASRPSAVLDDLQAAARPRTASLKRYAAILWLVLLVLLIYDFFYVKAHHSADTIILPQMITRPPHPISTVKPVIVKTAPVIPPTDPHAEQAYQDALQLIHTHHIPQALIELQALIQIFPDYQPARTTLATLLIQQHKTAEAIAILEPSVVQNPQNIDWMLLYARALIEQNQNQKALSALLSIVDVAQNNTDYLALLALCYQRTGHPDIAFSLYQKLLLKDPHNGRWLIGSGLTLEALQRPQQALLTYQEAKDQGQLSLSLQQFVLERIAALKSPP